MISRKGGSAATSTGELKALCFQDANEYCSKGGKQIQVTHTQDLVAGLARFPQAEVQFMCLSPGDPELRRPKLVQDPSQVIEIRK